MKVKIWVRLTMYIDFVCGIVWGIEPSGRFLIVSFTVDLLRGRIFKQLYRSLCLDLETYVNYT